MLKDQLQYNAANLLRKKMKFDAKFDEISLFPHKLFPGFSEILG